MRDDKEREETRNEVMSLLKQTWFWQVLFFSKPLLNGGNNISFADMGCCGWDPQPGLAHRGT